MTTSFQLFVDVQRLTADVDVCDGCVPCPPPAFPDLNALFADTFAAVDAALVVQLQQEVVDRTIQNNISTSFCVEKVRSNQDS
jgi:hypothetical protein